MTTTVISCADAIDSNDRSAGDAAHDIRTGRDAAGRAVEPQTPGDMTTEIESPRIESKMFEVADSCFEMFSIRELKQPKRILPELAAAFPDSSRTDLLKAITIALSWKRLLRAAGRRLH